MFEYLLNVINWFIKKLYQPCDPSSLAVIRILFGFLMAIDIVEERSGGNIDIIWGEPKNCHFPLFPFIRPTSLQYISILYGIMWLGSLGIMLGFKYKWSCLMFIIPYWYIFLLDKSHWNNHSYLYGLIGLILTATSANYFWSIDALLNPDISNKQIPYWNYFLLKFQIFLLYFYAGLKKTDMEWFEGYSMKDLGLHWVFDPLKFILSLNQIDYIVIHCFGFLLDLTASFFLIVSKTRPIALIFVGTFHLVNSRMFNIGMFPYVCLATLPIFCLSDWPKNLLTNKFNFWKETKKNKNCLYGGNTIGLKKKFITFLVVIYCGLQGFLPYSHFITKGFNNWTNGLYGYSWDMMVHSWDTILVVVKVVDNRTGKEHFLDPSAWTTNNRWNKHADMVVQYAECLQKNLLTELHEQSLKPKSSSLITKYLTSNDISIYLDVWCSMNGRFQQRMYDPNYDLLKANWSIFETPEFLMPLLNEYNDYRKMMTEIQNHVYSWSNYSDVLFIADFPGLYLDNYIADNLRNVSLTVLAGEVEYCDDEDGENIIKLSKGDRVNVQSGVFHKVTTISDIPSSYMYTYVNKTQENLKESDRSIIGNKRKLSPFPFIEESGVFFENLYKMFSIIYNSILNMLFDVPMVRRTKIR
nr:vitamin K-dependent gamma-carboxylase isoform X1 [Onthophagus taurus]XP_022908135.1 vitamin K-dependent gamma-carboxylase isoform X1 [Onthophagus taurus]XP_022908136.1 vitamin K-dependent gamma-carboxylase isoform X1 [Onthophagus taurus]